MMNSSRLESTAVEVVANVAPWLAPIPTAWLVFDRTMTHLHWPLWVAVVAGVTLELLGVAICATALMLYSYNRSRRKSDPAAAMWLPVGLGGLYLVAALGLTVLLDIAPQLAVLAPALFPVLSVASFVLLALRADHRMRLDAIEAERAQRKAEREERKVQAADTSPQPVQKLDTSGQVPSFRYKSEHVRWLNEQQPELTKTELAQAVGCDLSYVGRALRGRNGRER